MGSARPPTAPRDGAFSWRRGGAPPYLTSSELRRHNARETTGDLREPTAMHNFSAEEMRILDDVAGRHEMSLDAVVALFRALVEGNGRQAQFNHPDLGGMGQWSQGGMIMIGDMFNQSLRHRVDALCNELADLMRSRPPVGAEGAPFQSQSRGAESSFARSSLYN